MTQRQTAEVLGISRSYVSHIEKSYLERHKVKTLKQKTRIDGLHLCVKFLGLLLKAFLCRKVSGILFQKMLLRFF